MSRPDERTKVYTRCESCGKIARPEPGRELPEGWINLGMAPEDDRVGTAQDHAERAAAARARALGQTARD